MSYRLAVFDFDGTLADSFPWFMRTVNQAADRHRFRRITEADAERLRGQDARQIIRSVGLPVWKVPLVARLMRRRMSEDVGEIPLFPGVARTLEGLARAGVKLAIVSSNSERNVRQVLGPGSAALIRHWECEASLFGKRRRLRRVLTHSGVRAADAICIGDEIRDLIAAHRENIAFGAVSWGYTTPGALAAYSPREVFARVEDILERVA